MKKTLLLLCALLAGVSGAWAATPAAGAYPIEGKTYYLFANKYNSTDRYYLYWDDENDVLKHATANSKESNDYYKWTVTNVNEGIYTITNVGTGLSLKWNSGLTLGEDALEFDLSKEVNYTACVSLYATIPDGGRWLCVKNDTETFANGYKYNSFVNSSDYSINFVFEEVLSAHSLTDGSYYTIYCDNDNKQYLYDNAGTLAQTSSAPASDLRYVWQCIVSGDYYNFRNLQTGKYLSHKVISSSANNFTIETTDVYHDGCVKLKTNSTYMGFTTAGVPDQASHARYPKVTTDYSFDFRFDAIDLSSWCTGDLLGGSMSGSNKWTDTWTSGTSPSFTLTASASNINHLDNRTQGGLDIRSGSAGSSTYYITAPTGYVVTGYKIVGYALNGNQTVTPSKGGDATIFTTAGNSISVSGLRQGKASFTLSGANEGLFIRALQVSLAPYSSITSLPTANNKAYVIANARGTWNFADDATAMNAITPANTNYDNTQQQIALIYKNENYYLFSVNAGKYLTASNTLTSMPTDNEQVDIIATENATYPWFFRFKNYTDGSSKYTKNINISSGTIKIDGWGPDGSNASGCLDDGNRNAIIEVADFDATQALEMFDVRTVTYNLSYGGNSTFRTVSDVTVTVGGDPADFVPSSFVVPGVAFSYSPAAIEAGTTEVTVTATWNGPFNIADSYNADIQNIWYVVDMHTNENAYTWQYDSESGEIKTPVIAKNAYGSLTDNNLWCFVGNPWDGFKIYNKAAGNTMTIRKETTGNTVSYMSTTDDHNQFKLYNSNGAITNSYCFKLDGDDYYLNEQNMKLQGWNSNDEGSSCRFFAPGTYHLAAMSSWNLNAPVGAVGTKSFINSESLRTNMLEAQTNITNDPFCVVGQFTMMNTILNPVNESATIALSDGYYRFVNAYPSWTTNAPTIYYNSANDRIEWSKASNASDNVNSIFYIDATTPSIYSPNAEKYMSVINSTVSGSLAAEPGTTVFTSLGSAQYNVIVGGGTMHTAGHSSGAGNSGNLTSWDGGVNEASAWYIVKVEDVDVTLNNVGGYSYGTMYLPFGVTLSGAKAYILTVSGEWAIPTEIEQVPANTGVLIRAEGNVASATATINDAATADTEDNELVGTFVDITTDREAGEYILGNGDVGIGFYMRKSGKKIGANKAYLNFGADLGSGAVKGIRWDIVDGIEAVTNGQQPMVNSQIFNLAGQRMSKLQRGVNIVNGKKVLVK